MNDTSSTNPKQKKFDFKRLGVFFVHPRQAFQILSQEGRPAWQLPMIILSLALVLRIIVAGYLRTRAAAMGEMTLPPDWEWWSPEMQNNYMQAIQITQGPAYIYLIPVVTNLVALWLGWPIISSILHLTSTLLGGRGSQASILNVVAWSKLPFAIRDILRVIYMLAANHVINNPGLAGFSADPSGFGGNILKQLDLFLVWQLILLGIGLYQLNGISKIKTWLAVILVMLVVLLTQSGIATFFSSLTGSVVSRPFLF